MGTGNWFGRCAWAKRALAAVLPAVTIALTIGAGSAQAAQQVISTTGPLDHIWIDDTLQCQASHVGDTSYEFFPPSNTTGNCGTMLWTGGTLYGFIGTSFSNPTQTGVTGSGTTADPYKVVTTVAVGSTGLTITQTDTYVVGQENYHTDIVVNNNTSGAITGTLYHEGDCYLQGSDRGYGYLDAASGGIFCTATPNNNPAGRLLGFSPLTAGSSYLEAGYSTVHSGAPSTGASYPNMCDCTTYEDNGAGVSWPLNVPANSTQAISLKTTFSPTGSLNGGKPQVPSAPTAAPSTSSVGFTGTVNPNGLATTAHFEYQLDPSYGLNSPVAMTPDQTVGSDFSTHPVTASVSGLIPHVQYHVKLVATNRSGTTVGPDQTFATAQDPPPPPPVIGKSVNATPVSGIVYVQLPGIHAASDRLTKGSGFIPLTEARQLPTGTKIDSRAGSLKLIAAAAASAHIGKTQTATLGGGLFKVTQAKSGIVKGLTTFSLLEGDFVGAPTYASCGGRTGDVFGPTAYAAVSRRILQALHASVHGRFRTQGRYSAGTVRGTEWDTIDRCDGTLTIVHRGTVDVTDYRLRKTIHVHAGQRYLAKRK